MMLKHHTRRHLIVVMDQAPSHRSKKLKEFINLQKRLHVFFLPPRSPEYKPDEKRQFETRPAVAPIVKTFSLGLFQA